MINCIKTDADRSAGYVAKIYRDKASNQSRNNPYAYGGVCDLSYPTSKLRRGRVQGGGDISPTITTSCGVCKVMDKEMLEEKVERIEDYLVNDYGIFRLTARECLRLMAVSDEDIDKMEKVNSKSQLYKQAGNSIVVTVLMAIFSQLHIKGVRPWNDMSQDERQELVNSIRG